MHTVCLFTTYTVAYLLPPIGSPGASITPNTLEQVPLPFPLPSLPLSLEVAPLIAARGSGGQGRSQRGAWGPSPPPLLSKEKKAFPVEAQNMVVYIRKRLNIFVCIPSGAEAEGEGWGVW